MSGVGKYDVEAAALSIRLRARGVILLVVDGNKGSGMAVAVDAAEIELALSLPTLLRRMADDIESQHAAEGLPEAVFHRIPKDG